MSRTLDGRVVVRAGRWVALVALVVGSAAAGSPASADDLSSDREVQSGYLRPELGEPVPVSPAGRPDVDLAGLGMAYQKHVWQPADVAWPVPTSAEVDFSAAGGSANAGPVTVAAVGDASGSATSTPRHEAPPARVEVLGRDAARAVGVDGLLMIVSAPPGSGSVELSVDYSGFTGAFGGAWGSRLRLVELPGCAVTTPGRAACVDATLVQSVNDTDAQQVSATVQLDESRESADASGTLVLAVTAEESSEAGDFTATDLQAAGSWTHGGGAGGFSYAYPMRVPPAAGPVPDLTLGYSSQAHDGLTSATNNQASWVGDGWGYQPGFVERTYAACARDQSGGNNSVKTGDLCWEADSPSITMALQGVNTSLVKDDSTGQWHAAADQGWRIEKLGSPASPSGATTERWHVTTTDGTQYFFAGEASSSSSLLTVPVFGNHSGEPCRASQFKDSTCRQAYRWLLDKVVDTSGNVTRYFYATETGHYGAAGDPGNRQAYHRTGQLTRIDYGLREGSSAPATGRVEFTPADRCLSDCYTNGTPKGSSWPDTPWDLTCDATPCLKQVAPSFFTSKRLDKITTHVHDGSEFRPVDSWQLIHEFKDYGDESQVVMWLKSIQHTGHVGSTETTPKQTFIGNSLPNRVDHNGVAAIWRSRLSAITTETGGVITVNYSDRDCAAGDLPSSPHSNGRLCFPVWWTPPFQSEPELDWFHKYVVDSIVEQETTTSGGMVMTSHDYSTAGGGTSVLWGWDDSEFTDDDHRTYSQWRGYSQVTTRVGDSSEGAQLTTRTRYYRGMDGQPLPGGGKRSVQLTDPEGATVTDHRALAGASWEAASFLDGSIDSATTYRYFTGKTAARSHAGGELEAWLTGVRREDSRQRLTGTTWQRTRTDITFDDRGRVVQVNDLGDTAKTGDERCARTEYADNTSAWILNAMSRSETVAVGCGATAARPGDVIADQRTYYDGSDSLGAAPSQGLPTRTEVIDGWDGGPQYVTTSTTGYDGLGRPVEIADALGRISTTEYTPAGAGPLTKTTTTNPAGHQSVAEMEPAWGVVTTTVDANGRRTDLAYDPLGRLTAVWEPGLDKDDDPASARFNYQVNNDAPSVVTSERVNATGGYVTGVVLFDSLLRKIQTQQDTPQGGRLVTETSYDTRGLVEYISGPNWDETSGPKGEFVRVDQGADHARSWFTYDALGREARKELWSKNVKLWQTTTAYGDSTAGFLTRITPPDGGVPTGTIVNAHGETIEKRDYHGDTAAGSYDATTYSYDRAGRLDTVIDPVDNTWSYSYDLRGRIVAVDDPDAGSTTVVYDAAGQTIATTDARGQTVSHVYDELGRPVQRWDGDTDADQPIAEWSYDTVSGGLGLPATSTAHVDRQQIRTTVDAYDTAGRPTGTTTTVPAIPGMQALAGSYISVQSFHIDGTVKQKAVSGAGGLPAELIVYHYNTLGMPTGMVGTLFNSTFDTQTYVDSAVYTAHGELAQRTLGSAPQIYQTYSYADGTRRRQDFRLSRDAVGTTNVARLQYDYDQAGNILSIADAVADDPGQPERQCYTYDHLRRLTEAWAQAGVDPCADQPSIDAMGGPAPYWASYTFDVTGNRLTHTQHEPDGTDQTSTYTYPGHGGPQPHTLTSVTTGGQTNTYTWDPAGNLTSRTINGETETIEWNAQGKPDTITDHDGTTRMIYNPDGQRIARIDDNGDAHLFVTGHEISYTADTDTVTAVRTYQHNGQVIATRSSTSDGLQWLAADHHGTATWAIDATSMAATHRRQDPYGNPRGTQNHWPASQQDFVQGIKDPTGLIHIGARSYDPTTGRFISSDPITDFADSQQINGYTYANGNPITYTDPTGLRGVCAPDGINLCPDQPAKQQPTRKYQRANPPPRCPDGCMSDPGYGNKNVRSRSASPEYVPTQRPSPPGEPIVPPDRNTPAPQPGPSPNPPPDDGRHNEDPVLKYLEYKLNGPATTIKREMKVLEYVFEQCWNARSPEGNQIQCGFGPEAEEEYKRYAVQAYCESRSHQRVAAATSLGLATAGPLAVALGFTAAGSTVGIVGFGFATLEAQCAFELY
jgi:RHS repeat-associated protein